MAVKGKGKMVFVGIRNIANKEGNQEKKGKRVIDCVDK